MRDHYICRAQGRISGKVAMKLCVVERKSQGSALASWWGRHVGPDMATVLWRITNHKAWLPWQRRRPSRQGTRQAGEEESRSPESPEEGWRPSPQGPRSWDGPAPWPPSGSAGRPSGCRATGGAGLGGGGKRGPPGRGWSLGKGGAIGRGAGSEG